MLEFPDDPEVYGIKYQYMYGSEFLFRPVVDPGVTKVSVYLPAGNWVHLFTQETFGKAESGGWVEVDAPIGQPAVFYRVGSRVGEELVQQLMARDVL